MGKECKKSRNTVGLAILILVTLLLTLQSCGSTKYGCGQASFIKNANLCPAYH